MAFNDDEALQLRHVRSDETITVDRETAGNVEEQVADRVPRARAKRPRRLSPAVLGAIGAGGALGTPARVGVSHLISGSAGGFPWATLATNVSGTFVLGIVVTLLLERLWPSRIVRPFLATGVCGAYTTFSTWVVEMDLLIRSGRTGTAVLYAVASIAAGLIALLAGMALARFLPTLRARHTNPEGAAYQP